MRWVAHAALRPHRCAAIPFIGNSNAKKGFIDSGYDLPGWDPHVYVSVEAVEEMARMIGWQPNHVQAEYKRRTEALEARLAEREVELGRLEEQLAAVQVLKNSRFVQQGAPGRPKKVAT